MLVASGFRSLWLANVLTWSLLWLLLAGNVGAEFGGEPGTTLLPRVLPRDQLLHLPIVARAVPATNTTGSGNTTVTANTTTSAAPQSTAGWTPASQATDRQSFYVVIKVGDADFRVVLDTGSSDLWVVSSNCSTQACKSLPKYPLEYQSSGFQSVNGNATAFSVSFADGTGASGFVARERVELAGLVAVNQTIGLVSNSSILLSDQESGVLGLGYPRLSTISGTVTNSTPFFVSLAQQGLVDYPLFGLSLTNDLYGSLSLGAIDASIVTNPHNISWNNVAEFSPFGVESNRSSYLQWAIPLTSFGVEGSNSTQLTPLPTYANATGNISLALFDVGAPGIYGPYQDVTRLYELIDSARLIDANIGQWVVPCDTSVTLSLTFGRHTYLLQPSDYIIGPASGNPNLCLSWPRALPPSSDGIDWQIGSAFLKTVYSIFSYGIDTKEPPKIGLYPLTTGVASNSTSTTTTFTSSQTPTPSVNLTSFIPQTTIQTTLPNFIVPTPTFTTPPYTFNTSVPASVGGVVNSGLATSTYHAILAQAQATTGFNASAVPTISPSPSVVTVTLTNGQTTLSTFSLNAVPLGIPPGWKSAGISLSGEKAFSAIMVVQVLAIAFWTLGIY